MIDSKGIVIRNIYYMLAYAYQNLRQKNYTDIAAEDFENIQDLFAAILAEGISSQLRCGLALEYVQHSEELTSLRGKMDVMESYRLKKKRAGKLLCEYDELSENNLLNQILKTTAFVLMRSKEVTRKNKIALKRAMQLFSGVDTLEISEIRWGRLRYHRNNQTYHMLMNICYLLLRNLLASTEKGEIQFAEFIDTQAMPRLYEKFILEYYKRHFPELHAHASQISWDTDDGYIDFLPTMQTDVSLYYGDKCLIIDAKYYRNTMQQNRNFDAKRLHSDNLYQIFSYVKNKDTLHKGNVMGLLLYAKTGEDIVLKREYSLSGSKIMIRTLDLTGEFSLNQSQLNEIAALLKL